MSKSMSLLFDDKLNAIYTHYISIGVAICRQRTLLFAPLKDDHQDASEIFIADKAFMSPYCAPAGNGIRTRRLQIQNGLSSLHDISKAFASVLDFAGNNQL